VPNNKFVIDITAKDKTAQAVKSANDNFAKLVKGTKVGGIVEHFGKITEKGHSLLGIGKSLLTMGDNAAESAGGVGEAAGSMDMLAAGAGVAALGVVGVGAALVATAGAAFKFEDGLTKSAAATAYFAQIMGMSAHELQLWQLAGKQFGVSADAMASALQNVGNVLQDSTTQRGAAARAALVQLGVHVKYLKNHSVDAAAGMNDVADALQNGAHAAGMNNAQTAQYIYGLLGASGAEAFLVQSTKARQKAYEDAARSGAAMTDAQFAASRRFQQSVVDLDDKWHGLLNTLSTDVILSWLQPTIDGLNQIGELLGAAIAGKPQDAPVARNSAGKPEKDAAHGAVRASFNLFERAEEVLWPHMRHGAANGGASSPDAADAIPNVNYAGVKADDPGEEAPAVLKFYESQGWSKAQASGITAGIQAESDFNPRVWGDRGEAYGIGQWHADRRADFAKWSGHSMIGSTLDEQLRFKQYELTKGDRKHAGDMLRRTSDARTAGAIDSKYDETPGDEMGEMRARGALAGVIFAENGGKLAPPAAAAPVAMAANGGKPQSPAPASPAPANDGKTPSPAAAAPSPEATASNDAPPDIPGSTVTTVNGSVHIDIRMRGAPPGTVLSAQSSGPVTTSARVVSTMQGSA
jgi:hypothetical protein